MVRLALTGDLVRKLAGVALKSRLSGIRTRWTLRTTVGRFFWVFGARS
jgi:hypothetical protein